MALKKDSEEDNSLSLTQKLLLFWPQFLNGAAFNTQSQGRSLWGGWGEVTPPPPHNQI